MSEIKDGGPAFPCWEMGGQGPEPTGFGMTLRDYFAAAALQGSLAGEPGPHLIPERISVEAYQYADAMLRAREAS